MSHGGRPPFHLPLRVALFEEDKMAAGLKMHIEVKVDLDQCEDEVAIVTVTTHGRKPTSGRSLYVVRKPEESDGADLRAHWDT